MNRKFHDAPKVCFVITEKSKTSHPEEIVDQYFALVPEDLLVDGVNLPLYHYKDSFISTNSFYVSLGDYMKGIKEKVDLQYAELGVPTVIAASHDVVELIKTQFKKTEIIPITPRAYVRFYFQYRNEYDTRPNIICDTNFPKHLN
jgi:hypothetical protein